MTKDPSKRAMQFAATATSIIVGAVILGWAVTGVTSCSIEAGKREAILDAQINKYGFRRGDVSNIHKYPSECSTRYYDRGWGLQRCREAFEEWERRGEIWVEWEQEQ